MCALAGYSTMLFGVLFGGGEGLAITQNIFRQRGTVCLINVDTLKATLHNFGANISKFHFFSFRKQIDWAR